MITLFNSLSFFICHKIFITIFQYVKIIQLIPQKKKKRASLFDKLHFKIKICFKKNWLKEEDMVPFKVGNKITFMAQSNYSCLLKISINYCPNF